MYARDVGERRLTFGVSGMLWNRSLIMYDPETDSLWSHILGECMQGRLKGSKLEQIPSVMTDWETWQRGHPDTSVAWMSRTSRNYRRQFYRKPEQFVLGIADGDTTKSWSFDQLSRTPAINDRWNDKPVLVAFDPGSMTARLYESRLEDRTLTFRHDDNRLRDRETGSTWEPATGRAVAGPLSGKHLTPLPAIVSSKNVWLRFHPESK